MTPTQTIDFLSILGASDFEDRGETIRCSCPLAAYTHQSGRDNNPSFDWYLKPRPDGHCWSCGFTGDGSELVDRILYLGRPDRPERLADAMQLLATTKTDPLDISDVYQRRIDPPLTDWPEEWLTGYPRIVDLEETHPAVLYCAKRRVTYRVAKYLDLRWDGYKAMIVLPIRDYSGVLRGARGRSVLPNVEHKDRHWHYMNFGVNRAVFMGEDRIDFQRPVMVVEGIIDLASLTRVYRNVLGTTGTNLPQSKFDRLKGIGQLYTFFDIGKAADRARQRFNQQLGNRVRHIVPTPGRDDLGEMTVAEIKQQIIEAKKKG